MADRHLHYDLIGYVGVDSGKVLVVDPCYLVGATGPAPDDAWANLIDQMERSAPGAQEIGLAEIGLTGSGVWMWSTRGDGQFAVYRVYRDHEVMGLFVDFAGMLDDDVVTRCELAEMAAEQKEWEAQQELLASNEPS